MKHIRKRTIQTGRLFFSSSLSIGVQVLTLHLPIPLTAEFWVLRLFSDFLSSAYCGQKIVCCPDCATATATDLTKRICNDGDPRTINDMETLIGCSDPANPETCAPCAEEVVGLPIPSLSGMYRYSGSLHFLCCGIICTRS